MVALSGRSHWQRWSCQMPMPRAIHLGFSAVGGRSVTMRRCAALPSPNRRDRAAAVRARSSVSRPGRHSASTVNYISASRGNAVPLFQQLSRSAHSVLLSSGPASISGRPIRAAMPRSSPRSGRHRRCESRPGALRVEHSPKPICSKAQQQLSTPPQSPARGDGVRAPVGVVFCASRVTAGGRQPLGLGLRRYAAGYDAPAQSDPPEQRQIRLLAPVKNDMKII